MNPLAASIFFHAIGAASAAFCYTPQKKVRGWSWQSYWLVQASFCWLLLPVIGAFLTVPDYLTVVRDAPHDAMVRTFLLGMGYGVGSTAFGLAIRYVGFSITYALAIGISTVMGTAYAIAKGNTGLSDTTLHMQEFLAKAGSEWVLGGVAIGIVGMVFFGIAGKGKERDLATPGSGVSGNGKMLVGLALCLVAGALSAVYSMALAEGEPIARVAEAHASGHIILGIDGPTFRNNAIYPFSNAGTFLTTSLYCLFLHWRHKSLGEVVCLPEGTERPNLKLNWSMAILTGFLWYGQFFFYGFGHFFIMKVKGFDQVCWAVHMIMLILLGSLAGILFKEWKGCSRRTYIMLTGALVILTIGMISLNYGNYIGQQAGINPPPPAKSR